MMFYSPIMTSFRYTTDEIIRFYTDFTLEWNNASAGTRIYHDIKAAYKGPVRPVQE